MRTPSETHGQEKLLEVHTDLVDIHHHVVPPEYRAALVESGTEPAWLPRWDAHRSLRMMDRSGIAKAMASVPPPGIWMGDEPRARALARSCNEYLACLKKKYPSRFGGLAALPFPDLEGSRNELAFALDALGLDGVILFSNVEGRYVGDPAFEPLMADLDERGATVLLHPAELAGGDENAPLYPWAEYPIDLARSWSRLILSDTLSTYRNIDWVLGHAGGVVPFMAERLGKLHYVKRGKPRWGRILLDLALHRNGGLELAERVAYDTVGAANPVVHAALGRLGRPESIRFGSNFPFETEEGIQRALQFFATHPLLPREAPAASGARRKGRS